MDKKAKSLNPQREAAAQPAVSSFHHLNIFWVKLETFKKCESAIEPSENSSAAFLVR